ncbi:MAG: class I SAM-dependent methyltransferase [Candidatus Limnocylindrales bacterium]|jgi:ubiquinone/menaquinone biosynthesis C-methylase UbiE
MDRRAWVDERRANAEERFDRLYAPTYDEDDIPISATHGRFVEAVVESCRPGGSILDAACGTGRYFEMILAAGRQVVGIDQSAGMLAEARSKFPEVVLQKTGLQELRIEGEFDAAICVDAMEYVFPEDWPQVLANLRRAVSRGLIYLTVEQIPDSAINEAFVQATAAGLPVVHGETVRGGGYHYYPTVDRATGWILAAGLEIIEMG